MSKWFYQRNCYRNNDALQKNKKQKTKKKNTIAMVQLPNVLIYKVFIICLDYVLQTSINLIKENGLDLIRQDANDILQKL